MNWISFLLKAYSRFTDKSVILLFIVIVSSFIFLLLIKKGYLKVFQKKEYTIIPNLTIRNISSIAMLISMNIALIITLTMLSNRLIGLMFSIYPGIRFLIENILIKIGGIIFGPLIGIYIALTTDLLTVIFTSSVLHYGYLFSAIMNGFMGGIIHNLINKKNKFNSAALAILLKIFSLIIICYLFAANSNNSGELEIRFLSYNLSIYWIWFFMYISFLFLVSSFCLIFSVVCDRIKDQDMYKDNYWVQKFSDMYLFFQIFSVNFSSFIIIDVTALPLFDVKISSLPYEQFLIFRIITFLPMLLISSIVIWYIVKLFRSSGIINSFKLEEKLKTPKKLVIVKKPKENLRINLSERKYPLCIH